MRIVECWRRKHPRVSFFICGHAGFLELLESAFGISAVEVFQDDFQKPRLRCRVRKMVRRGTAIVLELLML